MTGLPLNVAVMTLDLVISNRSFAQAATALTRQVMNHHGSVKVAPIEHIAKKSRASGKCEMMIFVIEYDLMTFFAEIHACMVSV